MKIYIVEGTTGEYSDRQDWTVCAYRSEKKAEDHVRNAMLRAKEIEKSREDQYHVAAGVNEFDPDMRMDYTGTEHYTVECELKD
jgi:hypothetical protein